MNLTGIKMATTPGGAFRITFDPFERLRAMLATSSFGDVDVHTADDVVIRAVDRDPAAALRMVRLTDAPIENKLLVAAVAVTTGDDAVKVDATILCTELITDPAHFIFIINSANRVAIRRQRQQDQKAAGVNASTGVGDTVHAVAAPTTGSAGYQATPAAMILMAPSAPMPAAHAQPPASSDHDPAPEFAHGELIGEMLAVMKRTKAKMSPREIVEHLVNDRGLRLSQGDTTTLVAKARTVLSRQSKIRADLHRRENTKEGTVVYWVGAK